MQYCYFLLSLIFIASNLSAQNILVCEKVTLPKELEMSKNEFSGMAKWRDSFVLLIAEDPDKLMAVKLSDIEESISSQREISSRRLTRVDFTNIIDWKRRLQWNSKFGFEAGLVVRDSIYLTIETDLESCYLMKGLITQHGDRINITVLNAVSIKKPDNNMPDHNAGFESVAYLENTHTIVTWFERNRIHEQFTTYTFSAVDLKIVDSLRFENPLLFRLTDVSNTTDSEDSFWAINVHYHGKPSEIKYYIGMDAENRSRATRIIGDSPNQKSFVQILKLRVSNSKMTWRTYGKIDQMENWEGIIPFKQGILLLSDANRSSQNSKLYYYHF